MTHIDASQMDYRQLNAGTVMDNYPMPLPSELFDRTKGARYFSTIDLKNGFYKTDEKRPIESSVHTTRLKAALQILQYQIL